MALHAAQRQVMKTQGLTQPGGGGKFPIPNRTYLAKAIHAYGRSNSPAATKAWIIRRAHDLGAVDMLPAEWGVGPAGAAAALASKKK